MTYYSNNAGHVRGDLFKPLGKWMYSITIDMNNYYGHEFLREAIVEAVRTTPRELRGVLDYTVSENSDYILVVLEPYHRHAHPVMLYLNEFKNPDKGNE